MPVTTSITEFATRYHGDGPLPKSNEMRAQFWRDSSKIQRFSSSESDEESSDVDTFHDAKEGYNDYIIGIASAAEKKTYIDIRYKLSKRLGIISVDIRKNDGSSHPSDISTNRKNQLSHPQIGDTIYIKDVKNPRKASYCVGTITKPFKKISDISDSFNGRKELREGLIKNGLNSGATEKEVEQWFDTMLIFEYQCEVSWTRKDIPLEKDSDMWKKLHPNGRTTVRKC